MTEQLGLPPTNEFLTIKPGAARKLAMVVTFTLAAICGAVLLNHEDAIFRIFGLISLLAGVIGGPWVWWKYSKGTYQTTVSCAGLQVGDESPTIPWRDIEGFGTHDMGHYQVYTTVRLTNYASWISQLTPAQARRTMRAFKLGKAAVPVVSVLALATLRSPADIDTVKEVSDLNELFEGSDSVRDLVSLLAFNRHKYAGEILITAFQRDRSAQDFATFLEGWKARNQELTEQGGGEFAGREPIASEVATKAPRAPLAYAEVARVAAAAAEVATADRPTVETPLQASTAQQPPRGPSPEAATSKLAAGQASAASSPVRGILATTQRKVLAGGAAAVLGVIVLFAAMSGGGGRSNSGGGGSSAAIGSSRRGTDAASSTEVIATSELDPAPLADGSGESGGSEPQPPAQLADPPTTVGAAANQWLLDNVANRPDAKNCGLQERSDSQIKFDAIAYVGCDVDGLANGVSFTLYGSNSDLESFIADRRAAGRGNREDVCGPTWRFKSTPAGQVEGSILCSDAKIDGKPYAFVQWTEDAWRIFGNTAEDVEGVDVKNLYEIWFKKTLAASP